MQGCLIDANVWVAASFERHDHHAAANALFARTTPETPACICRAIQQSWLRLLTTPLLHRRYDSPTIANLDAVEIFKAAIQRPNVRWIESEPEGLDAFWLQLACSPSASPKVWMDAYLAAFAIGHDLEFVTLDRDFALFEKAGLKWTLLK